MALAVHCTRYGHSCGVRDVRDVLGRLLMDMYYSLDSASTYVGTPGPNYVHLKSFVNHSTQPTLAMDADDFTVYKTTRDIATCVIASVLQRHGIRHCCVSRQL